MNAVMAHEMLRRVLERTARLEALEAAVARIEQALRAGAVGDWRAVGREPGERA